MKTYLGELERLKKKGKMKVKYKNRTILLIYTNDNVYAIDDKCPHRGSSLFPGKIEDGVIYCKDHNLAITINSGRVTNESQADFLRLEPYNREVKKYPIEVIDGEIYLK